MRFLALLFFSAIQHGESCLKKAARTRVAKGLPVSFIDPKFLFIPPEALPTESELRDEFVFPAQFDLSREYPNCNLRRVFYQGVCGTCWAVASATVLSDAICIKTGTTTEYSAADLLGCCPTCGDYDGGYPYYAFDYFKSKGAVTGGYETDGCYPYKNSDNYYTKCPVNPACKRGTCPVKAFTVKRTVTGNDERQLMEALYVNRVPLVVGMFTNNDFMGYSGGIYKESPRPMNNFPDHAVKVIGWGTDYTSQEKYWIVVNSWGFGWGLNGTFHLRKGYNDMSLEKGMGGVSLAINTI